MLTKDLLNYRSRKDRVSPVFVKASDPTLLGVAEGLIQVFKGAIGLTLGEVEEQIAESPWGDHPLTPALRKLLFDRAGEDDDDGQVAARRWEVLQMAEACRLSGEHATLQSFQEAVVGGALLSHVQEQLYRDLPEFRVIKTFDDVAPSALLHRYNCAQVQGLLLLAQSVTVRLKAPTLADRRRFFRCLKFQRLLSEIATDGNDTVCTLSGPLRIFQHTQSYGMRLANFFPYVLQLPAWEMHAEVKLKGKVQMLQLDQSGGIASHYKMFAPVVPAELTAFITAFNSKSAEYQAAIGVDFLHLGQQSYCFPDVTFRSAAGHLVHLEIFHRWHAGQLAHRLQALKDLPEAPLTLAVAQDVAADQEVAALLKNSDWFDRHGYVFKNLPTPTGVQQVLLRHAAVPRTTT